MNSGRQYLLGGYWDLIKLDFPDLYKYSVDSGFNTIDIMTNDFLWAFVGGSGNYEEFDLNMLNDNILEKSVIYGPFGKIESYGHLEQYIKLNNGSNPFYLSKELIYYFNQGYAIRKDYNYEGQVNRVVGRLVDMGLMQKFMSDSLDTR